MWMPETPSTAVGAITAIKPWLVPAAIVLILKPSPAEFISYNPSHDRIYRHRYQYILCPADVYHRFGSWVEKKANGHCRHAKRLFPCGEIAALADDWPGPVCHQHRSEEHTSELQSLMRISYAVFCLKKKKTLQHT